MSRLESSLNTLNREIAVAEAEILSLQQNIADLDREIMNIEDLIQQKNNNLLDVKRETEKLQQEKAVSF